MAARLLADTTVLVLGGAGLVGTAISRRLALLKPQWRPGLIIVASQFEEQARDTVSQLEKEQQERLSYIPKLQDYKQLDFVPEWGDMFVRSEFAFEPRAKLLQEAASRKALLADLYDDLDAAYEKSHLVRVLQKHRPHVLIDCVNTATGLSYQNSFDAALRVRQALHEENNEDTVSAEAERMLLAQSVPALVRHIQIMSRVAEDVDVEQYMKVGTTGTGGMGLNLPFTHSEAKPSNLILAKNEAAFGHSGLLLLWSQTPGAPTVHEIKPGAAIGFRNMGIHSVADRYGNEHLRTPCLVHLEVGDGMPPCVLDVRENESDYPKVTKMATVAVDLGKNGLFTADEFRTLTAPGSMEMISPEEIAEVCVQELLGIGTGNNVLASIRGAVLRPGYRAGTLRTAADQLLAESVHSNKVTMPSVALGRLGPPLLSKILFEAQLLKLQFGGADGLERLADCNPVALSIELSAQVQKVAKQDLAGDFGTPSISSLSFVAPTIGVPVLLEGNLMLRGPNITVPEPVGNDNKFNLTTQETIDGHAQSGWVDLRQSNLQVWKERALHILAEPTVSARDTTALTGLHYHKGSKEIDAAALVSWIIAGEVHGQRDINTVSELDED